MGLQIEGLLLLVLLSVPLVSAEAEAADATMDSATMSKSMRSRLRRGRAGKVGQDGEDIELYQDSHSRTASMFSNEKLLALGAEITGEAYGKKLHELCDKMPTRYVGDEGNEKTAKWLEGQFSDLKLTTWKEPLNLVGLNQYIKEGMDPKNVFGVLVGTDQKDESILLGAHFDSINWEDGPGNGVSAPGVDDNGSGIAALLLAAKAIASGPRPRKTIIFAAFNAEEEGIFGSKAFASTIGSRKGHHAKTIDNLKAAIMMDEVAYAGRPEANDRVRKAIFETVGAVKGTGAILDTFAHAAKLNKETGDGIAGFVVNKNGFGSDHMSFLNKDIPAMLLIERDDIYHADTWGHSSKDTFEHVDFDYGASMTRLAVRATLALANPATKSTLLQRGGSNSERKRHSL